MSKDLNKVQLTGRLGKDPETRYTPQGSPITKLVIASNRRWRTAEGEDREDTEWFNVVAWNKLAEICSQYLQKGSRVYIEGRLQTHSWEDQATGQKRYMTEVIANDMIMLDSRRDTTGGGGGYEEADPGFQDSQVEQPARQYGAAPRGQQPARPAANGGPQRSAAPASTSRRPPAPAPAEDDDLPF